MNRDTIAGAIPRPTSDDLEAIAAVAGDYIEGWLDGDEGRMRSCLHPELVKRTIGRDPASGDWRLGRPADAEIMVQWTREGEGRTAIPRERAFEIVVEDVFRHIASVKVVSHPYMDYLHIAKLGERWFIVNVLWELREGEEPA